MILLGGNRLVPFMVVFSLWYCIKYIIVSTVWKPHIFMYDPQQLPAQSHPNRKSR